MAFLESPRLDACYSFGARGGPQFSTEVNKSAGGQRYANGNWLYPLHIYDITEGVRTEAKFAAIRALFYNVGGRRDGFRFKDWADFQAGAGPVHPTRQLLTTITVGTLYQLAVQYVSGARTFTRPIYKPVKVSVYRTSSGGAVTAITPTVNLATGQVTITGHTIGDTYAWAGEFDVPVAFVNDHLEAEIVNKGKGGLLVQWPSIQLEEIRL